MISGQSTTIRWTSNRFASNAWKYLTTRIEVTTRKSSTTLLICREIFPPSLDFINSCGIPGIGIMPFPDIQISIASCWSLPDSTIP